VARLPRTNALRIEHLTKSHFCQSFLPGNSPRCPAERSLWQVTDSLRLSHRCAVYSDPLVSPQATRTHPKTSQSVHLTPRLAIQKSLYPQSLHQSPVPSPYHVERPIRIPSVAHRPIPCLSGPQQHLLPSTSFWSPLLSLSVDATAEHVSSSSKRGLCSTTLHTRHDGSTCPTQGSTVYLIVTDLSAATRKPASPSTLFSLSFRCFFLCFATS